MTTAGFYWIEREKINWKSLGKLAREHKTFLPLQPRSFPTSLHCGEGLGLCRGGGCVRKAALRGLLTLSRNLVFSVPTVSVGVGKRLSPFSGFVVMMSLNNLGLRSKTSLNQTSFRIIRSDNYICVAISSLKWHSPD